MIKPYRRLRVCLVFSSSTFWEKAAEMVKSVEMIWSTIVTFNQERKQVDHLKLDLRGSPTYW